MDRTLELSLLDRILSHQRQRSTDLGPEVRLSPVDAYLSPDRFRREWHQVFERYPLAIADAGDVSEPGRYMTVRIRGVSVLVVRDHEGTLRAFKNVCRHRGSPLVATAAGRVGGCFTCPYHGWSYALDGSLRSMPFAEGFDRSVVEGARLVELPIEEHLGLLWAILTPGSNLDVRSYLGGFAAELESALAGLPTVINRVRSTRPMNWKLWIETGLESYHVACVHRESVSPYALNNLSLVDQERPHLRVLFAKRGLAELAATEPEARHLLDVANLFYLIFPSTMILVQRDRATRITVVPEDADRFEYDQSCRIAAAPADERSARRTERASELVNRVFEEDLRSAQAIHDNLSSGANRELTFGRHEFGLALFHDALTAALDPALDPALEASACR